MSSENLISSDEKISPKSRQVLNNLNDKSGIRKVSLEKGPCIGNVHSCLDRIAPYVNSKTAGGVQKSSTLTLPSILSEKYNSKTSLKLTILNLSGIVIRSQNIESDRCILPTLSSHVISSSRPETNYNGKQRRTSNNFIENKTLVQTPLSSGFNQNLHISASVTFTGSCSPMNMRVVSSSLCSTTGRLAVESLPVVIPDGMEDGLVAVWNNTSPLDQNDSTGQVIPSFDRSKGRIMAEPDSKPHLFLTFPEHKELTREVNKFGNFSDENTNVMNDRKCLLNLKPINNISKISSVNLFTTINAGNGSKDSINSKKMYYNGGVFTGMTQLPILRPKVNKPLPMTCSVSCKLSDLSELGETDVSSIRDEISKKNMSSRLEFRTSGSSYHPCSQNFTSGTENGDCVINNLVSNAKVILPKNKDHNALNSLSMNKNNVTRSLPEVVELHVSLQVKPTTSLLTDVCSFDEIVHVQSACAATVEGGGAVAHLILFPEDRFLDSTVCKDDEHENGRLLELPIRKRIVPLESRINISSTHNQTIYDNVNSDPLEHRSFGGFQSFGKNVPTLWVDLEEDAIIRVKLERCTEIDRMEGLGCDCKKMEFYVLTVQQQCDSYHEYTNFNENEDEDDVPSISETKDTHGPLCILGEKDNFKNNLMKERLQLQRFNVSKLREDNGVCSKEKYMCRDELINRNTIGSTFLNKVDFQSCEENANNVQKSHKPQHNNDKYLSAKAEDSNQQQYLEFTVDGFTKNEANVENELMTTSLIRPVFCAPGLGLDEILKKFSNMVKHCGDDVMGFDMDARSMDSTIGTISTV